MMSRQGSSSVLQSLTAQYTDSEGEEDGVDKSENRKRRSNSLSSDTQATAEAPSTTSSVASKEPPPVAISPAESNKSGTNTPQSGSSISAAEIRRVASRLVSYNNDAMSDEDENGDEEEDSNSRVEFPVLRASRPVSPDSEREQMMPGEELLPSEPTGKCPPDLQDKISRLYENMLQKRIDMNFSIQQRKQFRNPSIYEKLIDHLDIEEIGTNYPPEIYDPYQWGEDSFYENLSKIQREEMEKREKERRDRTKVEFVSGTAAKKPAGATGGQTGGSSTTQSGADEERKRKSKWDQTIPAHQASAVLTAVATGTKTAIPAFGTLASKKPKQT